MKKEINIYVVGTGFAGSILARKIAEELDLKVNVIEKRSNIGGNMYDYVDENGILIQKYGPHFLNTNKYWIIKYLEKYSNLIQYDCTLFTYIDDKYMQLPFNFRTLQQLVGFEKSEMLLDKMRKEFYGRDRVPMGDMLSNHDDLIRNFAKLLYDKAFKTYTAKMRGIPIEKIDTSVINRVQFCIGYDRRYLNKDFQFLPEYGFTKLISNMLSHKNINLILNQDAVEHLTFDNGRVFYDGKRIDLLIYTGGIDDLFHFKFGRLPYRTIVFKYNYFNKDKVQPVEIISYPQAIGYTRSTEYKQFNFHCDNHNKTVVVTEYPDVYDPNVPERSVPCYPIITSENLNLYSKYLDESKKYKCLFLCGRLAQYKYFNMDLVIESSFDVFEKIKKFIKEELC